MASKGGRHLTWEQRSVIEAGVREGRPASRIAKAIGVSPSTVTREVKSNRTVREPKRKGPRRASSRCALYRDCQRVGTACRRCSTALTECRSCRTRDCAGSCPDFVLRACGVTERWPYVCPAGCHKRSACSYPKCSYDASSAQASYEERLSSSREGRDVTDEQLAAMDALVAPLVRQGQSFEAIWAAHGDELPVCVRTAYSYQEAGLLSTANIELPRKVRLKPRRRKRPAGRARVDRTGRTYADFCELPLADRARVAQADSVEGRQADRRDVLSLHLVAVAFQLYLLKGKASPSEVVARLDDVERALGSAAAFEAALGVVLADRGVEFDGFEGMERSCTDPGARRCRVFYCDPMESNQKSQAERNHEQLRRILPKGRSRFDDLSAADVALCGSHVNSYPSAGRGGRCPFELASGVLPAPALRELGYGRVGPDEVVLRPYLMAHAVDQ